MSTIQEKIAVMQAFAEGKEIEVQNRGGALRNWRACEKPAWNWPICNYRVKKEPMVVYVNVYPTHCGPAHLEYSEAIKAKNPHSAGVTKKFIEVIEEEGK
jgi:hypothetical protein